MATIVQILIGVVFQGLVAIWLKSRLEASIKHEYDRALEDYRFEIYQREQAAKIATFFARWVKYNAKESKVLNAKELLDYREELTRMSYELCLWIHDEVLVRKIMLRLINDENALSIKELLIEIRELILGKKCKILKAEDIVNWSAE